MKKTIYLLLLCPLWGNGQNNNWQTAGNSGLNGNAFIGTTDGQPLMLKTNGQERLRVSGNGDVVLPSLAGRPVRYLMVDSNGVIVPGAPQREGGSDLDSLFDCGTVLWNGLGNNVSPYCKLGSLNPAPLRFITAGQDRMRITPTGLVGVGTFNPRSALQVGDVHGVGLSGGSTVTMVGLNIFFDGTQLRHQSPGAGAALILHHSTGRLQLGTAPNGAAGNAATLNPGITITPQGYVGVNQLNPSATLHVDGHAKVTGLLCAREVRVALQGNGCWPDYVFAPEYELLSLDSLRSFIMQNHHLPGLPPAADVEANGVEMGATLQALLKQTEELALHLLAMQAEVERLKRVNGSLETGGE